MIQRKLLPGSPEPKKYIEKYGDKLVCVRYKYDEEEGEKIKTVELVVAKAKWQKKDDHIPLNKNIFLRIEYGEIKLGRMVKAAEGVWLKKKKLWKLPYGTAKSPGLEDRVVQA